MPVTEFDENGKMIRSFGEGPVRQSPARGAHRSRGQHLGGDGSTHIVVKFDPPGKVLMTLGTKGQAGKWDEAAGTRLLNQPNEVAFGRNGDVFLVQGHTPGAMGDPRVFKFDKNGKFIKKWGGKGTDPGKFDVAHGIVISPKGQLWVTDRENQRIQIFDQDGNYVRELKYAGLPCALEFGDGVIWMVNGFTGQILKLDMDGKVLAAMGKPGNGRGRVRRSALHHGEPEGRDLCRGRHQGRPEVREEVAATSLQPAGRRWTHADDQDDALFVLRAVVVQLVRVMHHVGTRLHGNMLAGS